MRHAWLALIALGCAAGGGGTGGPRVAPADRHALGAGGYTTRLLGDEKPPSDHAGRPVTPKVSADFVGPPPSNDWWSSLIWRFDRGGQANPHSEPLFAHPLALKAEAEGLGLCGPTTPVLTARSYLFPYQQDLLVGVAGLDAAETRVESHDDWTVGVRWAGKTVGLRATIGHGLPFAYFEAQGGAALVRAKDFAVFAEAPGALGISVGGRAYGLFAPRGAAWTRLPDGRGVRSQLGGGRHFSVAALPDARPATLLQFQRHAMTFVTGSRVAWRYDSARAELTTTFTASTAVRDNGKGLAAEPLLALYPHQWKNLGRPLSGASYPSPRGPMKLLTGASFSTRLRFGGVLPVLPRPAGDGFELATLTSLIEGAADARDLFPKGLDGTRGTYWTGKSLQRVALLAWLAEQAGARDTRNRLVAALVGKLEDWLDGQTPNLFYYDKTWATLIGLPSEYRSGWELNDHHFHYGHFVFAAATVARFRPGWARAGAWGQMVDLLVKDCANGDRGDRRFPFLRHFDPYAGHSWANGPALFAEGNNEESSSEDANFAAALIFWGALTGRDDLRDLGIYLHATLVSAIEQYWFDVDGENFPPGFDRPALGMVWGAGGKFDTWWDRNPIYVHGINFLPFTGASLYLGRRPDYVRRNHAALLAANHGEVRLWRDIVWMYLALAEPQRALALSTANPYFEPEFGSSRAFVYHWLHALDHLGQVDTTVSADLPTYAVLRRNDTRHHVAFNPSATPRTVRFSDGVSLNLAPFEQKVATTLLPPSPRSRGEGRGEGSATHRAAR